MTRSDGDREVVPDVDESIVDAVGDVGVPDGEGTPPGEATAGPEYHLEKAREHARKALEDVDGTARIKVLEDLEVLVDDDVVDLRIAGELVRVIEREEALLLAKCLEVATTDDRGYAQPGAPVNPGP